LVTNLKDAKKTKNKKYIKQKQIHYVGQAGPRPLPPSHI